MTDARNSAAFRSLRFAVGVAVTGLLVALAMAGGSWWLWEREKKLATNTQRDESGVRSRLESIRRERDDLLGSEETYRMLATRGVFAPEQRLDFIETMEALKTRHKLVSLEYDLFPQRALKFESGVNYSSTDIRASRLKLRVKAIHDGELVAFLDEFRRIERGFFPVDKCYLRRSQVRETTSITPQSNLRTLPASGSTPRSGDADGEAVLATEIATEPDTIGAECTLEWVTIADKAPQNPAQAHIGRPKS